jgi:hypothetical protein
MRRAELVMALVLGVFSAYLMWKSAELPIGWIPREGPGGGAFPFWLSAGMLLCCVWIIVRWIRRTSPVARMEGPYMDRATVRIFVFVGGSLAVMLGLIHVIGVYGSVPLFLVFYIRFLGGHSWKFTIAFALIAPIVLFFFFEVALTITLPKGLTEPLFYPLYDLFL